MTRKRYWSRLRRRRQSAQCTTIKSRDSSGTETNVYTNLMATHTQKSSLEVNAEFGVVVANVADIFWYEPLISTGALPTITENHLVYDESNVRHEIVQSVNQGGEGGRLAVITERKR